MLPGTKWLLRSYRIYTTLRVGQIPLENAIFTYNHSKNITLILSQIAKAIIASRWLWISHLLKRVHLDMRSSLMENTHDPFLREMGWYV